MSRIRADQLLRDVIREIDYLTDLVATRRIELYPLDPTIKRAVERSVEIAGEAVRQLRQLDESMATAISDARKIVSVRTILAHDYRKVDAEIVLSIVRDHLPSMRREVEALRTAELL